MDFSLHYSRNKAQLSAPFNSTQLKEKRPQLPQLKKFWTSRTHTAVGLFIFPSNVTKRASGCIIRARECTESESRREKRSERYIHFCTRKISLIVQRAPTRRTTRELEFICFFSRLRWQIKIACSRTEKAHRPRDEKRRTPFWEQKTLVLPLHFLCVHSDKNEIEPSHIIYTVALGVTCIHMPFLQIYMLEFKGEWKLWKIFESLTMTRKLARKLVTYKYENRFLNKFK